MPAPPRRKWLQFSTRDVLWLTVVVALLLFAARQRSQRLVEKSEYERERAHAKAFRQSASQLLEHLTGKPFPASARP